jgi:hypothetical protein
VREILRHGWARNQRGKQQEFCRSLDDKQGALAQFGRCDGKLLRELPTRRSFRQPAGRRSWRGNERLILRGQYKPRSSFADLFAVEFRFGDLGALAGSDVLNKRAAFGVTAVQVP